MPGESQQVPDTAPDPTVLVTEAIERQARQDRDYLSAQLEVINEKIRAVCVLHNEKFRSVDETLSLIERQRVEQKADTKAAVDAALCVSADTPVLCADLVWRPAGDLLVGDELITPEKYPRPGGRRFVRGTVTANSLSEDTLLLVTAGGESVRCNPTHPWLVRRSDGHPFEWVRASDLRVGDRMSNPVDVWDVARTYEAGWLAGILDGEASLTFKSRREGGARLSIGQVDGLTADAIDDALKAYAGVIGRHTRPAQPYSSGGHSGHAQAQRRWQVDGRPDIMKLLGSVRPKRLLVNADQVWEGRTLRRKDGHPVVVSIEPVGLGTIANISTTTGTYFARGWSAQNTAQKRSGEGADRRDGQGDRQD